MDNTIVPAPGSDALVKHVNTHGDRRYDPVKVTRVTKARVFVKGPHAHSTEQEFRLDNLREYGEKSWRANQLIVDPAEIAKAHAEVAAEEARKKLAARGHAAVSRLRGLFEGWKMNERTEEEVLAVEELVARLSPPRPE